MSPQYPQQPGPPQWGQPPFQPQPQQSYPGAPGGSAQYPGRPPQYPGGPQQQYPGSPQQQYSGGPQQWPSAPGVPPAGPNRRPLWIALIVGLVLVLVVVFVIPKRFFTGAPAPGGSSSVATPPASLPGPGPASTAQPEPSPGGSTAPEPEPTTEEPPAPQLEFVDSTDGRFRLNLGDPLWQGGALPWVPYMTDEDLISVTTDQIVSIRVALEPWQAGPSITPETIAQQMIDTGAPPGFLAGDPPPITIAGEVPLGIAYDTPFVYMNSYYLELVGDHAVLILISGATKQEVNELTAWADGRIVRLG